jgi:hypothetical protein
MADPQTPRNPESDRPPEETPRKRRRRGYRGYPNSPGAGDVHTGSGFGGAGSLNRPGTPADAGVVSERTRDDVKDDS